MSSASSSLVGTRPNFCSSLVHQTIQMPDAIYHMNRHTDGTSLVRNRAGDGLANPPGGVGGKTKTTLVFIFLNGFHQAQIAFLDQIQKGYTAPNITFRNADHQTGVRFNQMGTG